MRFLMKEKACEVHRTPQIEKGPGPTASGRKPVSCGRWDQVHRGSQNPNHTWPEASLKGDGSPTRKFAHFRGAGVCLAVWVHRIHHKVNLWLRPGRKNSRRRLPLLPPCIHSGSVGSDGNSVHPRSAPSDYPISRRDSDIQDGIYIQITSELATPRSIPVHATHVWYTLCIKN